GFARGPGGHRRGWGRGSSAGWRAASAPCGVGCAPLDSPPARRGGHHAVPRSGPARRAIPPRVLPEESMTFVIAEPCIGVKDKSCVEVCPVNCIYEGEDMFYIHPDECIDCQACEAACPV